MRESASSFVSFNSDVAQNTVHCGSVSAPVSSSLKPRSPRTSFVFSISSRLRSPHSRRLRRCLVRRPRSRSRAPRNICIFRLTDAILRLIWANPAVNEVVSSAGSVAYREDASRTAKARGYESPRPPRRCTARSRIGADLYVIEPASAASAFAVWHRSICVMHRRSSINSMTP